MKKRFNWVDIVIILIIIGALGLGIKYFSNRSNDYVENKELVQVTVRIDGVKEETVNVVNVGDIFKDKDTNQVFGKVIDKRVTEARRAVETGDGTVVKSIVPNKYSIYITLEGNAIVTDDYINLGGRDVRMEGTIFLKSNISAVKTQVVDIKFVK